MSTTVLEPEVDVKQMNWTSFAKSSSVEYPTSVLNRNLHRAGPIRNLPNGKRMSN
jgi:hypothetical protein